MESSLRNNANQSNLIGNNLITILSTIVALNCSGSVYDSWPQDYGPIALENGLEKYDFVVVGAGSAGSLVAGRLAENPKYKILLIEAGGDPPIESEIPGLQWTTLFTDIDWQYPTETTSPCLGFKGGTCIWNKGKAIGGSHSINVMTFLRGNSRDFDEWEQAGNPGWGWKDILKYFRKTENFLQTDFYSEHGKDGPLGVDSYRSPKVEQNLIMKATQELGYKEIKDFVAGNNIGFGYYYGTLQDGKRMSTAKAFLTKELSNMHVIKHAVATRIIFDNTSKADRLSFVYKGKYNLEVRAKKEIILSAGSVETPKLLLLSGIGPRIHLNALNIPVVADLPVGNNLEDHIRVDLFFKYDWLRGSTKRLIDEFYDQWLQQDGNCGASVFDLTGFISTRGDSSFPDIQYLLTPKLNVSESTQMYDEAVRQSLIRQSNLTDRVIGICVVLLRPKSQGFIRLRSSDYRDCPLIQPNYYAHADDIKTMVRGIYKVLELENTDTFNEQQGSFIRIDLPECEGYGYRSAEYWSCYIKFMSSTIYHPVGSGRMGPEQDKTTVVDHYLKVHGVQSLRVIDASIMPNTVSANTNSATIMIGEKGADLIRSEWS